MADRSVTVRLELDIASYLAALKIAREQTRAFANDSSVSTRGTTTATKDLGTAVEDIGRKSDNATKKVVANNKAARHSYEQHRGVVLAITALVANLPAVVAPALGLLLAVPGAITLAGTAAGTTALAVHGMGDAFKALNAKDVDKIAESMDSLSPAARDFVHEVQGVRAEWGDLQRKVQQATFEPVIGKLDQLTTKFLPMLDVMLPQVGKAIGQVAAGTADWLSQTDTVGRFAAVLDDVRMELGHVVPLLANWSDAFLDLSHVAAPFLANLLDIISNLGARFKAFIASASATGQLDQLFKTTAFSVEALLSLLSKLSNALFTVLSSPGTYSAAKVLYGLFNALANVINGLATIFSKLPAPIQSVLLVMLAIGGVIPLVAKGFGALNTAFIELGAKLTALKTGFVGATVATREFGFTAETTTKQVGGFRAGIAGALGSLGNPWALAITAAVVGLSLIGAHMAETKAKTEEATRAYLEFGDAVKKARESGGSENVTDIIKQREEIQKLITETDRYGVSSKNVVDALSGDKTARIAVIASLKQHREELEKSLADHVGMEGQLDKEGDQIQAQIANIDAYTKQFERVAAQQEAAQKATDTYTKSLGANAAAHQSEAIMFGQFTALVDILNGATSTAAQKTDAFTATIKAIANTAMPAGMALDDLVGTLRGVEGSALASGQKADLFKQILDGITGVASPLDSKVAALTETFWGIADAELSAGDKADLLKKTWEALFQPQIDVTNATQDFNLALLGLKDQVDKGTTSLDMNSVGAIKNRQAVEDLINKNNDLYFANIAAGMSAEDAGKKHDENGRLIEEAGRKAGLTTGDVHGLNVEYGKTPGKVETNVTATGVDAVLQQLYRLKVAQYALDNNVSTAAAASAIAGQSGLFNQQVPFAARRAGGGPIVGPGGPTEDAIPALGPGGFRYRLSAGEHILTAAEVAALGGHEAVLALRRLILHNRSPQTKYPGDGSQGLKFAGGGQVWPFPVNVSGTKMPYTMAELEAKFGGGPALAFLKAQVGKPYIWAAAGPGGYDCSGIVSAVWNVLHHRSPYAHTFSTFNEAGYFPIGGFGGELTAGWSNPGDGGPGGGINDVGHTAALLKGKYAFESTGGVGVRMGPGVTPVGAFAHVGHYDNGGYLRPGWTLAYNGTGAPEAVMSGRHGIAVDVYVRDDTGRMLQVIRKEVRTKHGGDVQRALGD